MHYLLALARSAPASICFGIDTCFVSLWPSCPAKPRPKLKTLPSAVRTSVWWSPAATSTDGRSAGASVHTERTASFLARLAFGDARRVSQPQRSPRHLPRLPAVPAVPAEDGSLLDSTLVLWISEMARPTHSFDRLPIVAAGGGVRTGRYVHWASNTAAPENSSVDFLGLPHNHLLVSLAELFGVDVPSLGIESYAAWDGSTVDLRGGLAGLF